MLYKDEDFKLLYTHGQYKRDVGDAKVMGFVIGAGSTIAMVIFLLWGLPILLKMVG